MESSYKTKVINAVVTDPASIGYKKDRAECELIKCSHSDKCDLYKKGQCSFVSTMGWERCPYGTVQREQGFTAKSGKYQTWINSKEEEYSDVLRKLKGHSQYIAKVGDYVFLPYSFITLNESVPFLKHSSAFVKGLPFLHKDQFTMKVVKNICEFKPQALMGGEIKDYQKKSVPLFLKHLSESMPGFFSQLILEYPRAAKVVESFSNIGRKALIKTLTPNVGIFIESGKYKWTWNGTYLISKDYNSFLLPINDVIEHRIEPSDRSAIKVTDEGQVNSSTVFLD